MFDKENPEIKDIKGFSSLKKQRPDIVAAFKSGRGPQKEPVKERVTLRLDQEVLEYFKSGGAGYQTRINDVLKSFIKDRQ